MTMEIRIKRVHDPVEPEDGTRVLVDRVWPRGIRKADAAIDLWEKEIAPSTELRKWFGHDPQRWQGFRERYRAELADASGALDRIRHRAGDGPLTLVFAARDREHNNAVVLGEVLGELCASEGSSSGSGSPPCYASEFPEYNGLDRS